MESVEPVRSLFALAELVGAVPELRALFESDRTPAELAAALPEHPAYGRLRGPLERHLELYGDRVLQELKLECPGAADDPAFLLAMVRNYLGAGADFAAPGHSSLSSCRTRSP